MPRASTGPSVTTCHPASVLRKVAQTAKDWPQPLTSFSAASPARRPAPAQTATAAVGRGAAANKEAAAVGLARAPTSVAGCTATQVRGTGRRPARSLSGLSTHTASTGGSGAATGAGEADSATGEAEAGVAAAAFISLVYDTRLGPALRRSSRRASPTKAFTEAGATCATGARTRVAPSVTDSRGQRPGPSAKG